MAFGDLENNPTLPHGKAEGRQSEAATPELGCCPVRDKLSFSAEKIAWIKVSQPLLPSQRALSCESFASFLHSYLGAQVDY